jgi:fructuronate reductase
MVADVTPYEAMKLRMLNGTHSALAYVGYLAGHKTVAEAVADPVMAAYLRHLWRVEIIPTVAAPEGTDLAAYAEALMARFANPGIRHATWQIAMDGSQKLPQRLLGTIADRLAAGAPCDGLLVAVAAWMRYVGGVDEAGQPIDVRDPLGEDLRRAHKADPGATVAAILALRQVFSADLAAQLRPLLTPVYAEMVRRGARAMAEEVAR